MAKTSNCLQLIDRMPQQDQDAILARLDALQAKGLTAKEAQLQAAIDVLAQVEREGQARKSADRVTDTPAFKKWFGDSEVVDEYGQPLVVYHATNRSFDAFDTKRGELGSHFGPVEQANQVADAKQSNSNVVPAYLSIEKPLRLIDKGSFAADEVSQQLADMGLMTQAEADAIAKDIYDDGVTDSKLVAKLQAAIRKAGYDGVVYLNRREGFNPFGPDGVDGATLNEMGDDEVMEMFPEAQDSWIAFQPTQIKSAIGNNGQFDPANPDIRKSVDRDANFKRWSGGAPVIELQDYHEFRSGEPVVVEALHGTTNADLTEFKRSRANIESDMGAGFYASNTPEDVAANYANNDGPDLTSRIERATERLADSMQDDDQLAGELIAEYLKDTGSDVELTDDNLEDLKEDYIGLAADHASRKRFSEGAPNTMKLYMRFKNPVVIGDNETYLDYNESYDEETEEYGEPEGKLVEFTEALRDVAPGFDVGDREVEAAIGKMLEQAEGDGIKVTDALSIIKAEFMDASDEDGNSASSEIFRQTLSNIGFDGVIDTTVFDKFGPKMRRNGETYDRSGGMKGMNEGTAHFIAFEPEQIKSATGNSGEFGENRQILKSAERIARTPEFKKWFGGSLVVNADGTPKVVYRGEHGADGGIDFQSRLASLSFGTSEVANAYAAEPNDSADRAEAPRLYPVHLRIENPLMNDPSDPFIELGVIADKLGVGVAEAAARKFAAEIEETDNWDENFADDYDSVDALLDERPEAARELYTLAWRFFDAPEFVNAAKKAGYDGAIHAEYGVHSEDEEGAEYKVFGQDQVKSIFNKAPTNSRDITKSVDRPQFYSQLQRTIEGVPDRLATMAAPQWKLWLDSNGPKAGVKKDEIEWSGIKDYLDLQGKKKLSKDELSVYLDDSGVKVSEVVLGGAFGATERMELERLSDIPRRDRTEAEASRLSELQNAANQEDSAGRGTKYAQYTLPGGENYRELLITLPGGVSGKELAALDERIQELEDDRDGAEYDERDEIDQRIAAVQAERKALLGNGYRSSHWDEPNVLAHIRINDRTAQEPGYVVRNTRSSNPSEVFATREQAESYQVKLPASVTTEIVEQPRDVRVLFVEEVQSDWGQDGLKKGFKPTPAQRAKTESRIAELSDQIQAIRDSGVTYPADGTPVSEIDPKFLELQKLIEERVTLQSANLSDSNLPPPAPFVGKTEGWLNLALKRITMLAVEGGYDKVAFVNGEQSADRYDLSKQISSISYEPGSKPENEGLLQAWDLSRKMVMSEMVTTDRIEDYVGKEVAVRLLESNKVMGKHLLDGESVKVGGKGMIKFYDQIVPQALNKLLPKLGGDKLGAVNIGSMDTKQGREGDALLAELGIEVEGKRPPTQSGFDVTDKMRETVKQGLPLFSRDRQTSTPQFKSWFGDSKVVDADGKPLVVYTGTSKDVDFKSFKIPKNGAWFTDSPEEASMYAKENDSRDMKYEGGRYVDVNTASRVMPVYLRIENPATLSDEDMQSMRMASNYKKVQGQIFDKLRAKGHDGVDLGGGVFVVIKDPAQIKSAIGNDGGFDPGKKDITKSRDRKAPETKEFKAWFGDSKVVNAKGEPLMVFHGTKRSFDAFSKDVKPRWDNAQQLLGFYFTDSASLASDFAGGKQGSNVMPVYLSLQNPKVIRPNRIGGSYTAIIESDFNEDDAQKLIDDAKSEGHDGFVFLTSEGFSEYVAFEPTQIKSATGNNGSFDGANPDIRKSTARKPWFEDLSKLKVSANYQLGDLLKTSRKLSWWDRTIGTQYNLAQKQPEFKRVFDAVQRFIGDVSAYASRAADMAPNILPKLETLKDISKSPLSADDVKALRDPIFGGTLKYTRDENGEVVETDDVQKAGVVFSDDELRSMFELTDAQIGLYREARKAIDQSVTDLALSDMVRFLGEDGRDIAETVMASGNVDVALGVIQSHLEGIAAQTPARAEVMRTTLESIEAKGEQANRLMDRGYAPLSRFGEYTVYVVGENGEQEYFGMFESKADMNRMAREMAEQYPDAKVSTGTMSQESYKLFSGVTPETLALFGDQLGLEESGIDTKSEAFQAMLKVAKTNRSAMKRLIERKGIDGYSEDAGRVLAGFVYSNSRQISTNLHAGEIGKSAADVKDGDVKDAAIRLMEYVQNPREEAQALRGLMFTQFIGGSIASAMVNMTQPFTMTLPYLSQFDGAIGAGGRMKDAVKLAVAGIRNDADLKDALKRAEETGVVSPQEVHQLMAQAQGKGSLRSGDGTTRGDLEAKASNTLAKLSLGWGRLFSAAEQFNRRVTFIAAYKLARDQGMADPFAFAENAIAETQGVYNKGNKPAWARGAIGGTLFTFKQYSIGYVEFIRRMWGNGPEGKKAVGLALGVLFLMSGMGGLPGADDLDDVIDGFAQRVLGKSFDSKHAKKEFLASLMGQSWAEFVMSGVSGLPGMPIDVSGRMGLGNLVPGTGILTKKRDNAQDFKEFAGPAATLFTNAGTAAAKLASGELIEAAKAVSPIAAQNVFKGVDMATMGFYRDLKGRKVIDTNVGEAVLKGLGFQPRSVASVQEATATQANLIGQNKLRETEIADKWTAGRVEKNPAKIEEAKRMLADWNAKNPDSKIAISQTQINKRVQEANKTKAQRVAASAPKEIRSNVAKELQPTN